ncbi:MAG: hypothetical protein H6873_05570 [Hyphomicrobiaceae bacterium]|nr:hypothetical protein [Hyphomicrobiaceae bacterium]
MSAIERVDFHGDTLFAERAESGPPLVAIKPIVERLTIAWHGQLERIKRDPILSEGIRMIRIPSPGGPQESTALPLNLIPGFLFGIDDSRIADAEARKLVLAYKRECHDVLYRHFFGPVADLLGDWPLHEINTRARLVDLAIRLGGKAAGRRLWAELGLPPLDDRPPETRKGALQGLDFVRTFLAERTAETPGGRVQASRLKEAYDEWARETDAPSMTARAFAMCLDEIGIRKTQSNVNFYLGLRILHWGELFERS